MSAGTIISIMIGVVGCILAVFFYMNDSINKRIERTINDPKFIKKVADDIRLPFLIFDENERYLIDNGASKIIEKIKVVKENGKAIKKIVVSPNRLLPIAPILMSFDGEPEFEEPQKGEKFDWVYTVIERDSWGYASGKPPVKRFRLEIIDISNKG